MKPNVHNSYVNPTDVPQAASRLKRVGVLIGLAIFAVFSFAPRVADACYIPSNGPFESGVSEQDTTLPVLRSVSSVASTGEDGCGECAGEHWIVSVDGEDPGVIGTRITPALGYRIEVLSGTVSLEHQSPILAADNFSQQALPAIYLYGDIDEEATIRITPIDRAGNEGEPIEHTLEAFVETGGACSAQGRNSGLGILPLLAAVLFALRRRRTSD
ncbi:MAG: hypothetical protein JKY56_11165 [Kofleriaceae bacterium]|nr:hypothetical protein [Kofleriaceae bacterium]